MTNRKYNNIIILIAFALYIVYYRIFISTSDLQYSEFIHISAILVIAFIAVLLLGFKKDKLNHLKKSILKMTITEIIIFFAISYGLGTVTGFIKNSYSTDLLSIFQNTFIPIVYILGIEIFRYTMLNANKDKKSVIYIVTILITVLELIMNLKGIYMYNFETIFKNTAAIIIPTIIKNITISYLIIHGGLKPVLFYRLIMDTYIYILPVVPKLGDYINSVIGILLPTLIYMYAARVVDESSNELSEENSKKAIRLSDIPMTIFIVLLVGLISGHFTYAIIGVGSESMTPKIEKGDAVIYKKINKENEIKVGDILVFNSGSKIIIHRLVEIKEDGKETYYITKGDANNSNDSLNLTIDNIQGKVLFKIKYLAYPNLFLKELIDKE